jgi:hypothetical protein
MLYSREELQEIMLAKTAKQNLPLAKSAKTQDLKDTPKVSKIDDWVLIHGKGRHSPYAAMFHDHPVENDPNAQQFWQPVIEGRCVKCGEKPHNNLTFIQTMIRKNL